jgi:hypothetical protein
MAMFSEDFKVDAYLAFSGYLYGIYFNEYNSSWHCQPSAGLMTTGPQLGVGSALSVRQAEQDMAIKQQYYKSFLNFKSGMFTSG